MERDNIVKKGSKYLSAIIPSIAFCVLILDAKTALKGAQDGITLSLYSVIPSLFPFIVISLIFNAALAGKKFRLLQPICRLCGIPAGMESVLLLGLLGGYPIGAQSVNDAYTHGCIPRTSAQRLLGFCNNAGPAFIFGIVGNLFTDLGTVWWLWGIHILSALTVGFLLPDKNTVCRSSTPGDPLPLPKALENAAKIMAGICGWVILFRVIISFCTKWFLWAFSPPFQALFSGVLELTNGIHALLEIPLQGQRFVFTAVILAFGGICVSMQTIHVTHNLGAGLYFPGKIMQTMISLVLSGAVQYFIFPDEQVLHIPIYIFLICMLLLCLTCFYLHCRKKVVALPKQMLYNVGK